MEPPPAFSGPVPRTSHSPAELCAILGIGTHEDIAHLQLARQARRGRDTRMLVCTLCKGPSSTEVRLQSIRYFVNYQSRRLVPLPGLIDAGLQDQHTLWSSSGLLLTRKGPRKLFVAAAVGWPMRAPLSRAMPPALRSPEDLPPKAPEKKQDSVRRPSETRTPLR